MPRRPLHLILALALVCLGAGARAAEPVLLPGSSWSGSALLKAKLSARGAGSDSLQGAVAFELHFGPLGAPALTSNEFLLVLDDGFTALELPGTFVLDAKGRPLLTPDEAGFEDGLTDLIVDLCADVVDDPDLCDVFSLLELAIGKNELRVKARSRKGIETLQGRGKIEFAFLHPQGGPFVLVKLGFRTGKDVTRD